jgi:hypothetical protein
MRVFYARTTAWRSSWQINQARVYCTHHHHHHHHHLTGVAISWQPEISSKLQVCHTESLSEFCGARKKILGCVFITEPLLFMIWMTGLWLMGHSKHRVNHHHIAMICATWQKSSTSRVCFKLLQLRFQKITMNYIFLNNVLKSKY